MVILIFFVAHWQISVFMQSFFLHRYGAHKQFTMSKGWERFFHAMTWMTQGASFLSPRAYAIMHRMHHAFSDTDKDPHSPITEPNPLKMMWLTNTRYQDIKYGKSFPEKRFDDGNYPSWPLIDSKLSGMVPSILWGASYTLFYVLFATHWWMYFLLPIHFLMGAVHGFIVNYFGHKLGYRNFNSPDHSKNTLTFDFLAAGELFQNNHHKFGQSPSFAARWFEVDTTYLVMKVLHFVKIIDMSGSQVMRYEDAKRRERKHEARAAEAQLVSPTIDPAE